MDANYVPIADDDFRVMPARDPTLTRRFNMFGMLVQLVSWLSIKQPPGWRRSDRIADAGVGDAVDSSAA